MTLRNSLPFALFVTVLCGAANAANPPVPDCFYYFYPPVFVSCFDGDIPGDTEACSGASCQPSQDCSPGTFTDNAPTNPTVERLGVVPPGESGYAVETFTVYICSQEYECACIGTSGSQTCQADLANSEPSILVGRTLNTGAYCAVPLDPIE